MNTVLVPATTNCPETTATPATLGVGVGVGVGDMFDVPEPPHETHIEKMDPSSADIAILINGFIGDILTNGNCAGGDQRPTEHVSINTDPETRLSQSLAVGVYHELAHVLQPQTQTVDGKNVMTTLGPRFWGVRASISPFCRCRFQVVRCEE
jgi:hypothetical protein